MTVMIKAPNQTVSNLAYANINHIAKVDLYSFLLAAAFGLQYHALAKFFMFDALAKPILPVFPLKLPI